MLMGLRIRIDHNLHKVLVDSLFNRFFYYPGTPSRRTRRVKTDLRSCFGDIGLMWNAHVCASASH